MEQNITPLIDSQIPEHLRLDAPLFGQFLKTYYEYASQRDKSIGVIQNHLSEIDIDLCSDQNVEQFYLTYGKYLPTEMLVDRRNFIKLLNSIYSAKGTEKVLQLVFYCVFGEQITISYPSEQILRASDGIWVREKFITLTTEFGDEPSEQHIKFQLSNETGDYVFESNKIENYGSGIIRVYYSNLYDIIVDKNQLVNYYDGTNTLVYVGKVIPSPAAFTIVDPGQDWIVGQVIRFPGSVKDTIGKITQINSAGGITGLEILEFGYDHDYGQLCTIPSYKVQPVDQTVSHSSIITSFSPLAYHHTLNILDHVFGQDELVTGVHVSPDLGTTTFNQESIETVSTLIAPTPGITLETWFESKARVIVSLDTVGITTGYYSSERGHISNQNVRLQDNYFYQAFSYLIETTRDIKEYQDILKIVHPAGLKRFSTLSKMAEFLLTIEVERTISIDNLFLLDVYSALDILTLHVNKGITDTVNTSDTFTSDVIKYLISSATATDTGTSSVTISSYGSENYFAENYNLQTIELTLGF